MSVEELFSAAIGLPPDERLLLSDLLRDSVEPEQWPALSPEWLSELERRSAAYDAGQMPGDSWAVVRERTRRQG